MRDIDAEIVGENLRLARQSAGLTQNEVAGQLGLHINTWQKYVSGDRIKSWPRLVHVATALRSSPNGLLNYQDTEQTKDVLLDNLEQEFMAAAMQEVAQLAEQCGKTSDPAFWKVMSGAIVRVLLMSLSGATSADARIFLQGVATGLNSSDS